MMDFSILMYQIQPWTIHNNDLGIYLFTLMFMGSVSNLKIDVHMVCLVIS